MERNCFRLVAAFVAIVINLFGLGSFNTAKAQEVPDLVWNTRPIYYVLPGETFSWDFRVDSNMPEVARLVECDYHCFYPNVVNNTNFQYSGSNMWFYGNIINEWDAWSYHMNWISYYEEGPSFFDFGQMSFRNENPLGHQSTFGLQAIGNFGWQDYFYSFSNYLEQTIVTIDGVRGDINGDGIVSGYDAELLQQYCFNNGYVEWRYTNSGINAGRGTILFSQPTLLDAFVINTNHDDPNNPYNVGRWMSQTAYGNSNIQPAPYEQQINDNELTVNTEGLAVAVFGTLPDGTPWQSASWTPDGEFSCLLPSGLQNMRVEASQIEGVTDVNQPAIQPSSINLEQNYPNPFNPTTTIDFSLTTASQTSLKVYSLNGALVAILADDQMSAGQHSVQFDASAVASGIYIYTLTTNGQSQTRKMILQK